MKIPPCPHCKRTNLCAEYDLLIAWDQKMTQTAALHEDGVMDIFDVEMQGPAEEPDWTKVQVLCAPCGADRTQDFDVVITDSYGHKYPKVQNRRYDS